MSVDGAWRYVAVFNGANDDREYNLHDLGIDTEGRVIYSYFRRRVTAAMQGTLAPAAGDYYVLAPTVSGIAFIGFIDRYITAPTDRVRALTSSDSGMEVTLRVPPGHRYRLGVHSATRIRVTASGAAVSARSLHAGMAEITVTPTVPEFTLRLEREAPR